MKKIIALIIAGILIGVALGRWLSLKNLHTTTNLSFPFWAAQGLRPLKIVNLKFNNATSFPSKKNIKIISFSPKATITISYELAELVALRVGKNNDSIIHIRQDLILRDKKGNVLLLKPSILEVKRNLSEKPARFINEISLSKIPELPKGNYEIAVMVTDLIGFQTAQGTLYFEVKG